MMFTLLLSIAISALALLMLRRAYARVCRDRFEQRRPTGGVRTSPLAVGSSGHECFVFAQASDPHPLRQCRPLR
jgi:hypothetical protein